MRVVPVLWVEAAARLAGWAVGIFHPSGSFKMERIVRGAYWSRRLSGHGLWIGRGVQFEGDRIRLGRRVRLYDGGHYVTGRSGWISIGDDTHISRMSIVSGLGGVDIGRGCAISSHVAIYSVTADTKASQIARAERVKSTVTLGDNVYVGVGAKIIPGVTIGDNAVIAAGAVVIRDVPPGHLARGVPASTSPVTRRSTASDASRGED